MTGLPVIVVDASALYEALTNGPRAARVRDALAQDGDHAAPYLVDAEVAGLLRRDAMIRAIDPTTCGLAVRDLQEWPGERFPTYPFLDRVWELRDTVRTWDAFYVALSEGLDCPLVTLDGRLTRATGPRCRFVLVD